MEKDSPSPLRILWIMVLVLFAVVASRFLLAFGRMFLLLAGLALLGFGAWQLYRYLSARMEKRRHARSTEGVIEARIERCQAEIGKNRTAIHEIKKNISELEEKLERTIQASEESRQHTRRLIAGFQAEMELRRAKVHFLETCIRKLQAILQNFELSKALAQKKEELKMLREQNLDDIADLEELRSHIEYDRTYLETIDNLSTRMLGTQSLETVHALKKELEEMTRSLDESI
jgi:chromosome segregation ATPase